MYSTVEVLKNVYDVYICCFLDEEWRIIYHRIESSGSCFWVTMLLKFFMIISVNRPYLSVYIRRKTRIHTNMLT